MFFIICLFLWWLIGFLFMIWLTWDPEAITWGQLIGCIVLGIIGPTFTVILPFKIIIEANFWHKPIFGKRK